MIRSTAPPIRFATWSKLTTGAQSLKDATLVANFVAKKLINQRRIVHVVYTNTPRQHDPRGRTVYRYRRGRAHPRPPRSHFFFLINPPPPQISLLPHHAPLPS